MFESDYLGQYIYIIYIHVLLCQYCVFSYTHTFKHIQFSVYQMFNIYNKVIFGSKAAIKLAV